MRILALLVSMAALAGCVSTPAPTEDAAAACAGLCLDGAVEPVLEDCDFVGLTLSLPEDTYTVPDGFEVQRPGLTSTHPEARQLAYLSLLACQDSSFGDQATGPVSFAEISLLIEPPEGGPSTDFHEYVLQQVATGPLLETLRLRGYPALEGTVTIEETPTGRVARMAGAASLQADVVSGPFMDGTNPGFTSAHHTVGTWYTGYPECTRGAMGTSAAVVDPGTSILAEAVGEAGVLRGSDTQDDDCRLELAFKAA